MQNSNSFRLSWLSSLALAAAFTLLAFFLALIFRPSSGDALSSVTQLSIPVSGNAQICGENIIYLDGGSLRCINSEGKFVWNVGVDSGSSFSVSNHGVAVWCRKKLTVVETLTGDSIASKTMESEILSATVGDTYFAVALKPETNAKLLILDRAGKLVDTLSSFNKLTLLKFGFFEGQNIFWVMTLDSAGSTPTCRISTYIPGKRETGTIEDIDQLIYQVLFRSNYIAAVGTNYIRLYDYTANEHTDQRITVYGWYMEAMDEASDNPLMLFVLNQQMESVLSATDVRMIRGTEEHIVHLPFVCNSLSAMGDTMYGFSSETLVTCKFGDKTAVAYQLPIPIDSVIGITSNKAAVVRYNGSAYLFRLP